MASSKTNLVTIRACNSRVAAGEWEPSLLVLLDGVDGSVKVRDCVALFTTIFKWFAGELAVMLILVAVQACGEFHLINGVLPRWTVALGAIYGDVHAFQAIFGCGVLFHPKE